MARIAKEAGDLFHHPSDELGKDGGFKRSGFTRSAPANRREIARPLSIPGMG
jgi:hypothetical protein